MDRFFPGRPGLLLYLDGALAGERPALRHGCVLTICREPWECATRPLSALFADHPSLRILQFPFSLPRDLARTRHELAATAIPVPYSRFRASFLARFMAEFDTRVGRTGVLQHRSPLMLCSPFFGTCVTSAGFTVAPTSLQLAAFVRDTWPELSNCLVLDSGEFFAERYCYFVVDRCRFLVAWLRASGDHDDVLYLPPSIHPSKRKPCPRGCHVHVFRHSGAWGLFDVRSGPAQGEPGSFAARAAGSFQAAVISSISSEGDVSESSCDETASSSEQVPGPPFSVTADHLACSGGHGPLPAVTLADPVPTPSVPPDPGQDPLVAGINLGREEENGHVSLLQLQAVLGHSTSGPVKQPRAVATPRRSSCLPMLSDVVQHAERQSADAGFGERVAVVDGASAGAEADCSPRPVGPLLLNSPAIRLSLHAALQHNVRPTSDFSDTVKAVQTLAAVLQGVPTFALYPELAALDCDISIKHASLVCYAPWADLRQLLVGAQLHCSTDASLVQGKAAWAFCCLQKNAGFKLFFSGSGRCSHFSPGIL